MSKRSIPNVDWANQLENAIRVSQDFVGTFLIR
jgi:hypothetical protein